MHQMALKTVGVRVACLAAGVVLLRDLRVLLLEAGRVRHLYAMTVAAEGLGVA